MCIMRCQAGNTQRRPKTTVTTSAAGLGSGKLLGQRQTDVTAAFSEGSIVNTRLLGRNADLGSLGIDDSHLSDYPTRSRKGGLGLAGPGVSAATTGLNRRSSSSLGFLASDSTVTVTQMMPLIL
ncbi:hypothetical protein ElyMa_001761900 [Elysia marginata]|uniref:Uncharacterized protein n=1 Tax=Elysia marginata TaxID=1093978 RepID=A0AAV4EC68_9GAST|nr:hypothetical protein ElyMa_001761900 [Elysia marginata]